MYKDLSLKGNLSWRKRGRYWETEPFSHNIGQCPIPFLDKIRKGCASWLSACHHWWRQDDSYNIVKHLITMVVISAEENDDYKALIYKELKNREWYWVLQLADVLNSDDLTIEILDYKDIDSLCNLDITNTVWNTTYVTDENMLIIVRYKICLKYTTDGHNARKKCIIFKKQRIRFLFKYVLISFLEIHFWKENRSRQTLLSLASIFDKKDSISLECILICVNLIFFDHVATVLQSIMYIKKKFLNLRCVKKSWREHFKDEL